MSDLSDLIALIDAWKKGRPITTIEMGLSLQHHPSYEWGIQESAVLIAEYRLSAGSDVANAEQHWSDANAWYDSLPNDHLLRDIRGAMFSAARSLSYHWLTVGPTQLAANVQASEPHRVVRLRRLADTVELCGVPDAQE